MQAMFSTFFKKSRQKSVTSQVCYDDSGVLLRKYARLRIGTPSAQ
jgi:hypothetical protein